jgi:prepilin-type N-terminal cleavage/methylation domain-containing protein
MTWRIEHLSQRGFSLIELSVVIVVISLLIGAFLVPLGTQIEQRKLIETKSRLLLAKEALTTFAIANGRLPCPASATSNGVEVFAVGGNASNGNCALTAAGAFDGFLPGVTLGLDNLDSNGYYLDGWESAQNRMRYAVANPVIGTVPNPFTAAGALKLLTITQIGTAANLLFVCASGTGINTAGCNTAQPLNNGNAVAVIYSLGKNAPEIVSGTLTPQTDEAANLDGDHVFVSHGLVTTSAALYDDQLEWIGALALISKMVDAGALP